MKHCVYVWNDSNNGIYFTIISNDMQSNGERYFGINDASDSDAVSDTESFERMFKSFIKQKYGDCMFTELY